MHFLFFFFFFYSKKGLSELFTKSHSYLLCVNLITVWKNFTQVVFLFFRIKHKMYSCTQDFFKIMQFSGNFKGKPLFWANFGVRASLWGQNSAGTPLDQNPGSAPDIFAVVVIVLIVVIVDSTTSMLPQPKVWSSPNWPHVLDIVVHPCLNEGGLGERNTSIWCEWWVH